MNRARLRLRWRLLMRALFGGLMAAVLLITGTVQASASLKQEPSRWRLLDKKVVVVLLDGLRLSDISRENMPALWEMQRQGGIGVMNHNTGGGKQSPIAYLTLGAGAKAGLTTSLDPSAYTSFDADEPVPGEPGGTRGRDLYQRHLGEAAQGEIVYPHLPTLEAALRESRFAAVPGLLGQAVHDLNGRTAVIGNSDLGDQAYRPAVLMAMDRRGVVDEGDLRGGVLADPTRPYGMHADTELLYQRYRQLSPRANLIVIQAGDLPRVEAQHDWMEGTAFERQYRLALTEADKLVGRLLPEAGPDTLLAVLAPNKHPDPAAPPLTPVLLAGGGTEKGTLLSSPTTKREGLVANFDLAPTFVQFLGGEVSALPFQGQPIIGQVPTGQAAIQQVQNEGSLHILSGIVDRMLVPSQSRPLMVKPWLNTWIGLAFLIIAAVLVRRSWLRFLQPLAECLLIFPLTWLCVPLLAPQSVTSTVALTLAGSGVIYGLLQLVRNPRTRMTCLAVATSFLLIADLLNGAPLLRQSVFSYDPIAGARYYGIGNEYMGVLLGAALWTGHALLEQGRRQGGFFKEKGRWLALGLFVLLIYLFAAPTFGTNAGGAMAAAIGCTYAWLLLATPSQNKAWRRRTAGLLLASAGSVMVLFLLNTFLPAPQQTHIGRVAHQLLSGRFFEVGQIALRKLELNFHLLYVSAWGKLFVLFIVVCLLWWLRTSSEAETDAGTRYLRRNFKLLGVAALAVFLLNDSGVVAAALVLLYAVVPMLGADFSGSGAMRRKTSP
jgi:hypothetical protein